MTSLLVDTDVFVDHIRRASEIRPRGHRIHYSVVTRAELYARGNERLVDRVLAAYTEIEVDRAVAARAGRLRRTIGIAFQDAVIAATAQEYRLTLVTRNLRHFERVPKLRVRAEVP